MPSQDDNDTRIGVTVRDRNAGLRLSGLVMPDPIDKKEYERRLIEQQFRLRAVELAYRRLGLRGLVALEGWDASGKGGTIRRMTAHLDPRGIRVWPIGPPKPEEQGRHYLYRFFVLLPEPGQLAVFDRSWYGRVLVERVEALIPEDAWRRAYDEINNFERALADDGARIVKIFLHITPDEQLRRFEERIRSPYKRWKMTAEDIRNRRKWDDYVAATEEMIAQTATGRAPWHVIPADDKRRARIEALRIMAEALSNGVDIAPPPLDPEVARLAESLLGISTEG